MARVIAWASLLVGVLLIVAGMLHLWIVRGHYAAWRWLSGYDGCTCEDCLVNCFGGGGWHDSQFAPLPMMLAVVILLGGAAVAKVLLRIAAHGERELYEGGSCARCGYDRSGLPHDGPCPECGEAPLFGEVPSRIASRKHAQDFRPLC